MISTITTCPDLTLYFFPAYEDVLIDPPVLGHDDRNAVLDQDASDHLAVRPFQHFDDRAFAPPLAIDADHACQRPVAMQDLGHLFGIEEEIVTAIVRNKEAVAVRMPFDATGDQAGALRNDVRILAVAHQLRLALHRGKPPLEHVVLVLVNIEQDAQARQS
jgi:hypothetical protein